jgi:hypothetical protein
MAHCDICRIIVTEGVPGQFFPEDDSIIWRACLASHGRDAERMGAAPPGLESAEVSADSRNAGIKQPGGSISSNRRTEKAVAIAS